MGQYVEAFALGNAAIAGNVCLLPLYPGLMVMLADTRGRRASAGLGAIVLAGIVTFMVVLGFVLHQIGRAVADILDWLLPVMYGAVLILGIAMLVGRNPFRSMATAQVPLLRNPSATAFAYGVMLAPLTLPCTGPLIVSAFVIGSVSGQGALAESLVYFVAFALGFGWPLVVLPVLTLPFQRGSTSFLSRHHRKIEVGSGLLLIVIAAIGYWTSVRPSLS